MENSKTIAYIRSGNIYSDSRATKEIKTLLDNHYNVIVLGWSRKGEAEETEESCKKVFSGYEKKVSFHFYSNLTQSGSGVKNLFKFTGWFSFVKEELKSLAHQIDAIHACDLDTGFPAYHISKKYKIPLVYDIYDYYIDSHDLPAVVIPLIERMEIRVINYADLTIICTEERRRQISKSSPKKLVVLHNSPDVAKGELMSEQDALYDYAYCGVFNDRRLIGEILAAYPQHSDLRFIFAGSGKYTKLAQQLADKYPNFTFVGRIPYAQVLEFEKASLVLSAIYEPKYRNHQLCAPNKFYEAMALAKPVIVCKGTGIDIITEEEQIGCVIYYEAEQFYEKLEFLRKNIEICKTMGQRARTIYERSYQWSIMSDRLINAYLELFEVTEKYDNA